MTIELEQNTENVKDFAKGYTTLVRFAIDIWENCPKARKYYKKYSVLVTKPNGEEIGYRFEKEGEG